MEGRFGPFAQAWPRPDSNGHFQNGAPEHPMPYWSEVWSGLEYVFAIGLAQVGNTEAAVDVVKTVRRRFGGSRRNPFNEAECGSHYARALSSWGLVVAMTGFNYDARTGCMRFAVSSRPVRWFWSTGSAWGILDQGANGEPHVELEVLHGAVLVERLVVGPREYRSKRSPLLRAPTRTEFEDRGSAWLEH
jgi:non-lysosomal glucosylceramidase